jgi:O-acetyl-ADP-ribose deacetylase (regulator of RNase III)
MTRWLLSVLVCTEADVNIIYKQGDMFKGPERWLLHGCNAQGVMGSGVAKRVKELYPEAFLAYLAMAQSGQMKLGGLSWSSEVGGRVMFNGITQEFYGRDGKQYVSYEAIGDVIERLNHCAQYSDDYLTPRRVLHVAMPKIGAGLGGGDWDIIAEIIEQGSTHFQPVVYTLE